MSLFARCALLMAILLAPGALRTPGIAAARTDVEAIRPYAPSASAAAGKRRSLERAGVQASAARLTGRRLTVKVRLSHRTRVRLVILDGHRAFEWSRSTLPRGPYFYNGLLPYALEAARPKLRITARNLVTGRSGRGHVPIKVIGRNRPPTAIMLSSTTVQENSPPGTRVGSLRAKDPDRGDSGSFSLVAGSGDHDNDSFAIEGDVLTTRAPLNHEDRPTRTIRLRVTDTRGAFFEEVFTITVLDVDEWPVEG